MFELSISTTTDKQHYICDIFNKLKKEIKCDEGVAIKCNYSGRSYFSFAVPDKKKDYYKSKIMDYIVFMIIDDYKFDYFKQNLSIARQNIISQSFLKAISIFDSEMDSEFIKRQIEFKGEILIDSLFYFKLNTLLEKWKKTSFIINQNQILSSNDSMIEVLKYLTMSSENNLATVDILIGKKQIKFNSSLKRKCYKRNFEGCSDFLTEIVKLNPIKINLKTSDDDGSDRVVDFLNQIFADKIYLIN